MSDLLTHSPPSPADARPAPLGGTPLPPPPPPAPDDDRPDRRGLLAIIGALALLAAAVMGLLWMSARSDRNDVAAERDAAQAATVAESDRAEAAAAELTETQSDLDAVERTNEQLTADKQAAETDAAEAAARAEEAAATVAALEADNADLTAEVAALEASLADAETAAADATAQAEATADADAPAEFDMAAAVEFARFIGESLASIDGPTVLGQGQHTCLGTAVANDIGLDAIGAGLQADASSGATSTLVEAIERGAISCGIDPSAIF